MNMKKSLILFFLIFSLNSFSQNRLKVYFIAHSISTRTEGKSVIRKNGWNIVTNPKEANLIFVVCRSGLYYPLSSSYRNIKELDEAADGLMNITGDNYHLYQFNLSKNGSISETHHKHYEARD
jgi:hypothetical protein